MVCLNIAKSHVVSLLRATLPNLYDSETYHPIHKDTKIPTINYHNLTLTHIPQMLDILGDSDHALSLDTKRKSPQTGVVPI